MKLKLTQRIRERESHRHWGQGSPRDKNFPAQFPWGTDTVSLWGVNIHRALELFKFCCSRQNPKTVSFFLFFFFLVKWNGRKYFCFLGQILRKCWKLGKLRALGSPLCGWTHSPGRTERAMGGSSSTGWIYPYILNIFIYYLYAFVLFKLCILNLQVKTKQKICTWCDASSFFPFLQDQLLENSFFSCSHSQICLCIPTASPQLLRSGYLDIWFIFPKLFIENDHLLH